MVVIYKPQSTVYFCPIDIHATDKKRVVITRGDKSFETPVINLRVYPYQVRDKVKVAGDVGEIKSIKLNGGHVDRVELTILTKGGGELTLLPSVSDIEFADEYVGEG